MKKAALLELARKHGVEVEFCIDDWSGYVEIRDGNSYVGVAVFTRKKLQSLVDILRKNKIKINN